MSGRTDAGRVVHSFIDDGPSILLFHAEGAIGDEVGRTDERGRVRGGGRAAMRKRLLMAWPAAVLVIVVAIAAVGDPISPQENPLGPSPLPATPGPLTSVAGDPPPALALAMAVDSPGASADPAGTSMAMGAENPWIVYASGERIRLVRGDGADDHVILADIGLRQRGAAWSRDGRLVFEADFGAASQLWVADPDSGEASPLTDIDLACSTACVFTADATWNGDGTAIAYVRRTVARGAVTSNELVVVDVADRSTRSLLVDDRHLLRAPSWEPNGHRIVVQRDGGPDAMRGQAETAVLVMLDARDAQPTPTPVPGTGTDARDPSWGVDGLIAYATTRVGDPTNPGADTGSALVAVDPDSGVSLTLLAFREGAERVTDPAWWPNGEGLLYGRLAPHAIVPVVRTVNLRTRLEQSATGDETAVGFDPDLRRATP